MSQEEKKNWQINIENDIDEVCSIYGVAAVDDIFSRYDATCFDDLGSLYYADVFADLELMINDV
jgi:hypothetical protein